VRNLVFASTVLVLAAFAADPSRELVYLTMDDCPQGGCSVPVFDKGYMFKVKDVTSRSGPGPDGFSIWDPEGIFMYKATPLSQEGNPGSITKPAADTDGTVVVGLTWGERGNRKVGLAFFDSHGTQTRFVDTGGYMPAAFVFAPDHSIWTVGWARKPNGEYPESEYAIVRKYSRDGVQTGAYLQRSLFPSGLQPGGSGVSWIQVAKDRVGMMLYPGQTSQFPEWVELDLQGNLIGRWKIGEWNGGGYGYTEDGQLYSYPYNRDLKRGELKAFDRATSSWKPVESGPQPTGFLLGAEGNSLVFRVRHTGNIDGVHTLWFKVD
jgi:hypothetical protein